MKILYVDEEDGYSDEVSEACDTGIREFEHEASFDKVYYARRTAGWSSD